MLLADGITVVALDPHIGRGCGGPADGALGAFCRDIVVLVAADHRPDGDRARSSSSITTPARSDGRATRRSIRESDEITCGFGPFVYTADGSSRHASGMPTAAGSTGRRRSPEAGDIELYREVALVRSGADAGTIVAVERETGEVLWARPAAEVGTLVSIIGRVREDAAGVFTLLPLTGDIVNHTALAPGTSFEVVDSSDTRVVVATGSVVTAYGMNDLGTSWQLDVGGVPDEFAVGAGHLVVRAGSVLRGYR